VIGTGLWIFVSGDPATGSVVKRNPDYFLKGLFYADGVEFTVNNDRGDADRPVHGDNQGRQVPHRIHPYPCHPSAGCPARERLEREPGRHKTPAGSSTAASKVLPHSETVQALLLLPRPASLFGMSTV